MARKIMTSEPDDIPTRLHPNPGAPAPRMMGTSGSQEGGGPLSTLGALKSSLSMRSSHSIQKINADLIDFQGYTDRLSDNPEEDKKLLESLKTDGQHIPILVTPCPESVGRFKIVYGRRRLRALKALKMDALVIVKDLDQAQMVHLQAVENSMRLNLSFSDLASSVGDLIEAGFERQEIARILNISETHYFRLKQTLEVIGTDCLKVIGSAPDVGRRGWMDMVQYVTDMGEVAGREVILDALKSNIKLNDRFTVAYEALKSIVETSEKIETKETRKPGVVRRPGKKIKNSTLGDVRARVMKDKLQLEFHGDEEMREWLFSHFEDALRAVEAEYKAQTA